MSAFRKFLMGLSWVGMLILYHIYVKDYNFIDLKPPVTLFSRTVTCMTLVWCICLSFVISLHSLSAAESGHGFVLIESFSPGENRTVWAELKLCFRASDSHTALSLLPLFTLGASSKMFFLHPCLYTLVLTEFLRTSQFLRDSRTQGLLEINYQLNSMVIAGAWQWGAGWAQQSWENTRATHVVLGSH